MWSTLKAFGNLVDFVMGNYHSQFLKALQKRDRESAIDIYSKKKTVRDSITLKPNEPLSGDTDLNSVLHYVALLNMKTVYLDLLQNAHCIPEKKNEQRRNCLHLIAMGRYDSEKFDMMSETLANGLTGMDLKHVLSEKDEDGNTVLHLAAGKGLDECVDLLIESGSELSATNNAKETPADMATSAGHNALATKLETKIVFEGDDLTTAPVEPDPEVLQEIAAGRRGLKDADIRSMKDSLLIETATMLGVSLLTAQVLLRNHEWSKEGLLEAWMEDPAAVCEAAGVDLPATLGVEQLDQDSAVQKSPTKTLEECAICYLETSAEVVVPCGHHFCTPCWKQYLEDKILCGESQSIVCPEYACYRPVPLDVIEQVVSPEMARRFLSFDLKSFVDSNPNMRWCPTPGCGQAVTLSSDSDSPEGQQVTVHCGNFHYFCWNCMRSSHQPCSCETWVKWLEHVEEMRPHVGNTTVAQADEAASSKWLADRSKPCPKCKSPIEKTEGCNHMCCKSCKHDFCWVCLDNWKIHNSSTGGYFECNRYDAQKKATTLLESRRTSYYDNAKEWEKISRFLHYYERYKEHLNSLGLEEPFLTKARDKMEVLALSVTGLDSHMTSHIDHMSFIEDAVRELLKCRRLLAASYPYAYYLDTRQRRKFENLQAALEQVTEMLAEVVARPHLRKPRSEIIRLTHEARTKRTLVLDTPLPSPEPQVEDSDVTTFLRALGERSRERSRDFPRRLRSVQEKPHDQGDNDLERVLEESRQEYEAEKQLQEDIEKAKAQSMRSPAHHVTQEVTPDWLSRLDTDYDTLSWPVLSLSSPTIPEQAEPSPPPTPHFHSSQTPTEEWGPLFGEDEDLETALALSARDQEAHGATNMMSINMDSNRLSDQLPPELMVLMDTSRHGTHV